MGEDAGIDIDTGIDLGGSDGLDGTGYGGEFDEFGNPTGFSETGIYTSPQVNAARPPGLFNLPNFQKNAIKSFSTTFTPGAIMLPKTWGQADIDRVEYNRTIKGGGFTPRPEFNPDGSRKLSFDSSVPSYPTTPNTFQHPPKMPVNSMMPSGSSSPLPAYSPGASNPNVDPNNKPTETTTRRSGGGGGSGGGSFGGAPFASRTTQIPVFENIHAVEKQPPGLPFQPVIPTGNDGHNRAFFQVQEELLKALFPYWKAQQQF